MIEKILFYIGMIVISMAALVIIIRLVIIPLFRFLFHFFKWVFRSLPILILLAIFVPGAIDEGVYLIVILFLTIVDTIKLGDSGGYYGDHYVLNKKSKIAHRASDPSANTIGYNHREDVYPTEYELEGRGFRIKKEN